MRHQQADRCGLPRSWCLSYEMQGKQSQKFPPPSPFSKIHLGYERHIHLFPQGSPALAHTCRISLMATPTAIGDYFILAELPLSTTGLWPGSTQLVPSTADSRLPEPHGLPWVLWWLS